MSAKTEHADVSPAQALAAQRTWATPPAPPPVVDQLQVALAELDALRARELENHDALRAARARVTALEGRERQLIDQVTSEETRQLSVAKAERGEARRDLRAVEKLLRDTQQHFVDRGESELTLCRAITRYFGNTR